ncbi:MAG: hypothetical protein V9G20_20400 [Candidatus Promineifilaceae bacterium]|nr:hypothetical protein [Chloroflexota bacterium]
MEINGILGILSGTTAFMGLLRALQVGGNNKGWVIASAVVLGQLLVTAWVRPAWAGYVGAVLCLLLIVLPSLGLLWLDRLSMRQQYRRAQLLAGLLRYLHPADGWSQLPRLFRALALAKEGQERDAAAILKEKEIPSTLGRTVVAQFYLLRGRWDELLVWIEKHYDDKALLRDPSIMVTLVQALGENGDLNKMMARYVLFDKPLRRANRMQLALMQMMVFAFCGRKDLVERLFTGRLAQFPPSIHTFWLATADLACGRTQIGLEALHQMVSQCQEDKEWYEKVDDMTLQSDAGQARLSKMSDWCDEQVIAAAQRRLQHHLANPQQALDVAAQAQLAWAEAGLLI